VKLWKDALAALWRQKWLWLGLTVITGVLVADVYIWLGLAVATVWHLLAHVVLALLGVALVGFALWWTRRRLGAPAVRVAARLPWFWLAVAVSLAAALGLPYALLHWVPAFDTFSAQLLSALARTFVAGLIFTGALAWLHACAVLAGVDDVVPVLEAEPPA
jgi:hypothetical protein